MKNLIKKHAEKIRFGLVGVVNTLLDFTILFILVTVTGLGSIFANYISTSVTLVFSFFANKTITFKQNDKSSLKQMVYFLVITIFGLWVIQPVMIGLMSFILTRFDFITNVFLFLISLAGDWLKTEHLVLLISKGFATVASLIWNYLMYRRFVFAK